MDTLNSDALSRARQSGLESLSVTDLLTLMVTREPRDVATNETAVANYFRGYPATRLKDLSHQELNAVGGLEHYESTRLLAALELGRRVATLGTVKEAAVTRSEEAFGRFRHLQELKQEHFCVAFFDSKGHETGQKVVHVGTLNMSVVGAREVFREAVRHNAASIIVAHNHPSGDPDPSPEDIQVTKVLADAGRLLDIPVLDHIIVGHPGQGPGGRGYVSLNERGAL